MTALSKEDVVQLIEELGAGSNWLSGKHDVYSYNRQPKIAAMFLKAFAEQGLLELIAELRKPHDWKIEGFGHFKDAKTSPSDSPFRAADVLEHFTALARADLVAENERLKGIVNAELDIDSNNAGTKQQRKLDGKMEVGQLLENCEDSTTSNLKAKGKFVLKDDFNGDFDRLVASAKALLELDHSGALVPHGIGGLAVGILSSLCVRISTMNSQLTASRTALAAAEAREAKLLESLKHQVFWVEGAINCKDWVWDFDQKESAQRCLDLANVRIAQPRGDSALREMIATAIDEFVYLFKRHVGGDGEFWLHELEDYRDSIRSLVEKAKGK